MPTMPQDLQAAPPADDSGAPDAPDAQGAPDGNDPSQMIGYIDPNASPKVKTFLLAAKQFLLSPQGAQALKGLLAKAQGDPATPIAMLINTTIEKLQDKFGPLTDEEHDQVAVHLAGWIASSLQHMGCPGLDDAQGRQDLIGRILQASDQMTRGGETNEPPGQDPGMAQAPPAGQPPAPAPQNGPMAQFGGGP